MEERFIKLQNVLMIKIHKETWKMESEKSSDNINSVSNNASFYGYIMSKRWYWKKTHVEQESIKNGFTTDRPRAYLDKDASLGSTKKLTETLKFKREIQMINQKRVTCIIFS